MAIQYCRVFGILLFTIGIDGHPPNFQVTQDRANERRVANESDDLPYFIQIPSTTITLSETYYEFSKPITVLEANPNIGDGSNIIYDMKIHTQEETNVQNTFILRQINNTAYIKLGSKLDFETAQEYTITITASNIQGKKAETTFKIAIQDENDNVPLFTGSFNGVIVEHEPVGTFVMQIMARDADGTPAHNIVSYRLDGPAQQFFHIDSETGNITSLVEFDRETREVYPVTVIAEDNSPSVLLNNGMPNKAVKHFFIRVMDKNDHQPQFEQLYYTVSNIPEDAAVDTRVITVKATDLDKDAEIKYSIVKNNFGMAFKIDEKTGVISVNNQLDYESITEYNLIIKAEDGVFNNTAHVRIEIENVNDIAPQILTLTNVTIPENTIPTGCVLNLYAYDPDIENFQYPQNIQYKLPKEHEHLLSIDDNGCLKLLQPLDRDPPHGIDVLQTYITITDENGKGKTATETLHIFVEDRNDNAPQLAEGISVVWSENRPSGMITKLATEDADGEDNGAPFTYSIDPEAPIEIKKRFQTVEDELYSLVELDREHQKQYLIPILIRDSGDKPMSAVSTLLVVIGDENDNEMKMGESHILVHNYEAQLAHKQIGRVYVNDPDDWDLSDKQFLWNEMTTEEIRKHFQLNSNNGMITMQKGTPYGQYDLQFVVVEESSYFPRHNVSALVKVSVKEITHETVEQSGSVRFYNVTAEEFVSPLQTPDQHSTPMHRLQQSIATILSTTPDQVDIFAINNRKLARGNFLDVFFTVEDTIYTASEVLDGVLSLHLRRIEVDVGHRIAMIGIDECIEKEEICEHGCKNKLHVFQEPIVVLTNTSSFVGLTTFVEAECISEMLPLDTTCLNGGIFKNNRCECLDGFEGPHCEKLHISFDGNGYAIYRSFYSGNITNIGIEMIARSKDGLVLYMGPLNYNPSSKVQPFLALEIVEGMLVLLLDNGTGTRRFEHQQLVLNEPTTVQLLLQPQWIEIKTINNMMVSSRSRYENYDFRRILLGNSPVQVGGTVIDMEQLGLLYRWKHVPQTKGIGGVLSNLTINNHIIDFEQLEYQQNVSFSYQRLTTYNSFISGWFLCFFLSIFIILIISIFFLTKLKSNGLKRCKKMFIRAPFPQRLSVFFEVDERSDQLSGDKLVSQNDSDAFV